MMGPMPSSRAPVPAEDLMIVPANQASWDDLVAIFGTADYSGRCQCQRFKVPGWIWRDSTQEHRTGMLRTPTGCGRPEAASTSGLVAYVDGEPAGWVAVEPRTAYPKLRTSRVPWRGRDEDKADDGVWAVTCFAVRKGYRGRGLTYPLARATIDFARERGARAVEGYPMEPQPGKEVTWGELHVGARQVFEDAGFEEVTRPPCDGWSCGSTSPDGVGQEVLRRTSCQAIHASNRPPGVARCSRSASSSRSTSGRSPNMRYSTTRSGSHTCGIGSPRSTDSPQSGHGMNRDRNNATSWPGGLPARRSPNSLWPGVPGGPRVTGGQVPERRLTWQTTQP